MDKIMAFGGAIFLAFTFCAATLTPPAAMAHESHRSHGHVTVLETIEIVGRVPAPEPVTDEMVIAQLVLETGLSHETVAEFYNDPRYAEVYVHSDGEGHHTLMAIER